MNRAPAWRYRCLIILLGMIAYAPTLKVGFLWDDHYTIQGNPTITHWSWENLQHDFTSGLFGSHTGGGDFYRPLQPLSQRVSFSLFGIHPWGYHLTNLAFHILNALLIVELVIALGFAPLAAWLCGSLFVAHPDIVSEIMMVSGRAEPMCLSFSLLALLGMWSESPTAWWGGTLAFLLALFSKESALMVPLQFGLIVWFTGQSGRKLWRCLLWIFPLALYLALYHHAIQGALPWIGLPLTFLFFVKAFPRILLHYVRLAVFPWHLYSDPLIPASHHAFWPLSLLLVLALFATLWQQRNRTGLFCAAWFLLPLLPKTIMMMTHGTMLDHWIYASLLGILLPIALLLQSAWESRSQDLRKLAGAATAAILIFWIFLSQWNVALRGTDEKLFRWSLRFRTQPEMRGNLGWVLLSENKTLEAIQYLPVVEPAQLTDGPIAENLIRAYRQSGQPQKAADLLHGLQQLHSKDPRWIPILQRLQKS